MNESRALTQSRGGRRIPFSFPADVLLFRVGAFMHDAAFGGKYIFRPGLLNVDERALAFAEQQVLQS